MKLFTSGRDPRADQAGVFLAMHKKPSTVHVQQQYEAFEVHTERGLMRGEAGDYIVFDPISKQVWPISQEYLGMHYKEGEAHP